LNIASALLKQVLLLQDFDTWSYLRKHYLATEFHTLYTAINKHCDKYHKLPTFESLKFEIRDSATLEKLLAIESIEVDTDAYQLLEYLKNEYTQKEILDALEMYLEKSVSFEDAAESLAHLHQIVLDVGARVELTNPEENMQRISLFESDENIAKHISLGLNSDFDAQQKFALDDYILIGGKRGAGKSIVSANIASRVYQSVVQLYISL